MSLRGSKPTPGKRQPILHVEGRQGSLAVIRMSSRIMGSVGGFSVLAVLTPGWVFLCLLLPNLSDRNKNSA